MKQKKNHRTKSGWIKRIVLICLAVIILAVLFVTNYFVDFGVKSDFKIPNVMPDISVSKESFDHMVDAWSKQDEDARNWIAEVGSEMVEVVSEDGFHLSAEVVKAFPTSHRWVIAVHGYRGAHSDMYATAFFYAQQEYNLLLPDLRGCGNSEGAYLGMGWLDRSDLKKWIDFITQTDPEAQIVLHGISMGGASVMMLSGDVLPSNVKALVEDCGYTSVWDIFESELHLLFCLPAFPLLHITSAFCKLRAGYSFGEASSITQIKNATLPMLFIHGSEDNFVPTSMVYTLYDAYPAPKDLLVVEGAWHGMSGNHNPDLYYGKVFSFLSQYIS